jgi:hypothetical protein
MTGPRNQGLEEWRTDQRIWEQGEVRSFQRCAGAGLGMDVTPASTAEEADTMLTPAPPPKRQKMSRRQHLYKPLPARPPKLKDVVEEDEELEDKLFESYKWGIRTQILRKASPQWRTTT